LPNLPAASSSCSFSAAGRKRNQLLSARGGDLERLLEQDVLARLCAALDQLEVRVRRREDQHRVDRAIVEDDFEPVGEREFSEMREALGELGAALGTRAVGIRDCHARLEIDQALGVRRDGHAEADYCNVDGAHGAAIAIHR
jgi:hypothetical protein